VQITAVPDDNQAHKILIVEDNLELLMLMQQLLKAYYHVYLARDGEEAFEIVHKNNIDLIISDVMMPKMNGLELTLKIKEDEKLKHLPIILLTAKTQEEDEQLALEAGADDYIIKPFRIKDLKLRIDNIIENRKRMQIEPISQAENEKPVEKPLSPNEQFVNRALEFVHEHLEDEDYDRDALAADMGTSASTLYNKLRAITGMNVSTFIRDIRMKEAKRLAEQNPMIRVSDLAYSVGFHDPRYFSTCFKKQFGIQPKEYLENLQHPTPEK
jgi:DNA-binding response OmpR family regulator